MSASKKRRELNRAKVEHDNARLSAQFARSNHAMLNMAESALALRIKELELQLQSRTFGRSGDVFKLAANIMADCGCSTDNSALLDRIQGRLFDFVDFQHDLINELRAKKFTRFNNEDCWIYQGDGEDHLDSLVCPVVISAKELAKLTSKANS